MELENARYEQHKICEFISEYKAYITCIIEEQVTIMSNYMTAR